jgi:hypothetical protein
MRQVRIISALLLSAIAALPFVGCMDADDATIVSASASGGDRQWVFSGEQVSALDTWLRANIRSCRRGFATPPNGRVHVSFEQAKGSKGSLTLFDESGWANTAMLGNGEAPCAITSRTEDMTTLRRLIGDTP